MNTGLDITINKGIGQITFGMPKDEVIALLGKPTEEDSLQLEDEAPTIVFLYDEQLLTFYFNEGLLSCIEVNNEEATLLGEKIFNLSEKEIVTLMVKNNFTKQDIDTEFGLEKMVSFEEAALDFYFDNEELVSISFGLTE